MTRIELAGDDAADGLVALVVAVVEILVDVMEREAIRRMEADQLSAEEVERVGTQFAAIEAELDRLKAEAEVADAVDDLHGQLDGLVRDLVHRTDVADARGRPGVFEGE